MPTYGRRTYLAAAIESVIAQTLTSWRLTISDNGPGGGEAAEVVEPYLKDPRVRYAPTGEVLSQAENWTRAIRMGDAPYVALLHDDDVWDADFLARRVAFLEANPACGFVFSDFREIDEAGKDITGYAIHPPRS